MRKTHRSSFLRSTPTCVGKNSTGFVIAPGPPPHVWGKLIYSILQLTWNQPHLCGENTHNGTPFDLNTGTPHTCGETNRFEFCSSETAPRMWGKRTLTGIILRRDSPTYVGKTLLQLLTVLKRPEHPTCVGKTINLITTLFRTTPHVWGKLEPINQILDTNRSTPPMWGKHPTSHNIRTTPLLWGKYFSTKHGLFMEHPTYVGNITMSTSLHRDNPTCVWGIQYLRELVILGTPHTCGENL